MSCAGEACHATPTHKGLATRKPRLHIGVGRGGAQRQQHLANIDSSKVQLLQRRGVRDKVAGLGLLQGPLVLAGFVGHSVKFKRWNSWYRRAARVGSGRSCWTVNEFLMLSLLNIEVDNSSNHAQYHFAKLDSYRDP